MDAGRFDRIVRAWTATGSRRPVLGFVAASAAGLLGLADLSAKKKKKKKVKLCLNGQTITVPKQQQGSYLNQGATSGACSGACGPCQGDKTCQNGTCACPNGEIECDTNICVPANAECCSDGQCQGVGRICRHGRCVTGQGTCPSGSDSCTFADAICNRDCRCFQSTEGETRCGASISGDCGNCQSTADCVALYPDTPGVFCIKSGPNCCPSSCQRPCPS